MYIYIYVHNICKQSEVVDMLGVTQKTLVDLGE